MYCEFRINIRYRTNFTGHQCSQKGPRTILKYVTCQITPNTNLGNIDHKKIKLLPLDSSHQGDFNKPNFIKIQSQVILKTPLK